MIQSELIPIEINTKIRAGPALEAILDAVSSWSTGSASVTTDIGKF